MTTTPIYQLDAFTDAPFSGNPAAVCPLEAWLPDATMQAIAAENNLSETAFYVPEGDGYRLRWFTPTVEVPLCGHATLATAWLILKHQEPGRERVRFQTRSGPLEVTALDGGGLRMDLPASPPTASAPPQALLDALGGEPLEALSAGKILVRYGSEAEIRALTPDMAALAPLTGEAGVIVTALGEEEGVDFVSRYFAPWAGIPEDPVTGAAHCVLTPYWVAQLGRNPLQAHQVSQRGGRLRCTLQGDRVHIEGACVLVMEGRLHLPG